MNGQEIQFVIRLVSGYWPSPEMGNDEIDVWMRQLAQCDDVELATNIVDSLARTGRDFRPTAGQLAAEYRARKPRFPRLPSGAAVAALELTTEEKTPEEWLADAREKLQNAEGPLAKDLSSTLEKAQV